DAVGRRPERVRVVRRRNERERRCACNAARVRERRARKRRVDIAGCGPCRGSRRMRYLSTHGDTRPEPLGRALADGLAPDGGLYVPEALPLSRPEAFSGRASLPTLAAGLLEPFFRGDALAPELAAIAAESLDLPAPLRAIAPRSWLLELFHGPT